MTGVHRARRLLGRRRERPCKNDLECTRDEIECTRGPIESTGIQSNGAGINASAPEFKSAAPGIKTGALDLKPSPLKLDLGGQEIQSGALNSFLTGSNSNPVHRNPDRMDSKPCRVRSNRDRVDSKPRRVRSSPTRVDSKACRVHRDPIEWTRSLARCAQVHLGSTRSLFGCAQIQFESTRSLVECTGILIEWARSLSGCVEIRFGGLDVVVGAQESVARPPERVFGRPRLFRGTRVISAGGGEGQVGPGRFQCSTLFAVSPVLVTSQPATRCSRLMPRGSLQLGSGCCLSTGGTKRPGRDNSSRLPL